MVWQTLLHITVSPVSFSTVKYVIVGIITETFDFLNRYVLHICLLCVGKLMFRVL